MTDTTRIQLTVNDVSHSLQVSSDESLLDILRDRLQLKGTKCGCNVGTCGCCTVILNGKAAIEEETAS